MMGNCLCYPWEYLSIYFTAKSAIQIHLSFFYSYFCNVKQNKFFYKIGQFLKIKCAIPRSAYNGLPECEQKLITETSPYSFGNFRKLSSYNCFMPI